MAEDVISGITDKFNAGSIGDTMGHVAKHLAIMGLCMAIPMVAMAMPMDATLLDVVVQTGHQAWEMAAGLIQSTPTVLDSVIDQGLAGNIAPTTLESVGMGHGVAAHGASAAAASSTAASSACATPAFEEWLRNASASGDLPMALEDSQGSGLCEYWADEYGHK